MKIKISPFKIVLALLFLGLVMLVDFARRDMKLDVDILRESLMNIPGIVMENIHMTREISGDLWNVRVPYLQQDGDAVSLKSIDIRRTISGDKGEWYFFGREGVYSNDQKAASINGLLGTLEANNRTWNLESQKLNWQEDKNTFVFPEGLVIYDDEFMLKTPHASMDESGVILLQRGGVIQWVRPLER